MSLAALAEEQRSQPQQDAVEKAGQASVEKAAEFFDETLISEAAPPLGTSAKRKGGRPRLLTDEVRRQVVLLLSVGLSRRRAAERVGVSHTTISQAAKNDPDFAAELERAEDLAGAERNLHIAALSRRSWKAAAWLVVHHQKYRASESKKGRGDFDETQAPVANGRSDL
jgi:hypothetical protein